MSTQTEAEKKAATAAAAEAAEATRKAADADAAEAARVTADAEAAKAEAKKPAAKKKDADILVAVHRIVYGKNQVAPPASFLRASDLSAADLEFLTESGAVREPNEAEALVAEAALNDPIG